MASRENSIVIVEARYYTAIADQLIAGVTAVLDAANVTHERIEVPGVFEVPAGISLAMGPRRMRYGGALALGCVIRGETDHYDHICRESSRALMDLAMRDGIALGFGILTCETLEQAEARADPARKNKGAEAANACLRMMELNRTLRPGE